jgi:integrase
VNKHLKRWCEANDIEPFTFYAARHTWASLARKQGVDKSTIDDCLGHKGTFQVTDIYAERAWGLMQEANRKVLDLFTW